MKRKHQAEQHRLGLYKSGQHGVEPFKLVSQEAVDHERASLARQERERARQESARKQLSMFE